MTLTEWTDTVAKMSPDERRAMGAALLATRIWMRAGKGKAKAPNVEAALAMSPRLADQAIANIYPGERVLPPPKRAKT